MWVGEAPKRGDARKKGHGGIECPASGQASARGWAVFGFLLAKGEPANAAATGHAGAGSAHLLAFTVNHGLVAAGVAAAIGSASFAGFMMARNNSHPLFGGIEHLMIFAQPAGGSSESRRRLSPEHGSPRSVDFSATGSIDRSAPTRVAEGAGAPRETDTESSRAPLNGYVLRFERKGAVVVEGPKGSYAAAPGVVVPGAGRILSIQNRNGRWIVQTENGSIGEAAL